MILVVDDDDTLGKVLSTQLDKLGFKADTARSAEEALAMVEQTKYALILMDVRMPGLDGCSAAQRIRETDRDVIIVGVTAEDRKQECIDAGMNAYYQKPVLLDHLQEIVNRFL